MKIKTGLYFAFFLSCSLLPISFAIGQCSVLGVSPRAISFPAKPTSTPTVTVTTSTEGCTDYPVEQIGTFFQIYKSTMGITVTCSENTTLFSRTGRILIDNNIYVEISQEAACPPQDPPGDITGTSVVCQSATGTYSTTSVPEATYYQWSVTDGTVSSGQGTLTAVIAFNSSNATVSVKARNSCLSYSTEKSFPVTVASRPAAPTDITYNENNLCIGSNRTFLVSPIVSGFTYSWDVQGSGWAFADDNITSASVNITIGSGPGTIKVKAVNSSGCSSPEYSETANGMVTSPIFNVFGNGSVCPGASTSIDLDGSHANYTYTLFADGVGTESKVGTNASISFAVTPPINDPPTYTIEAQDPAGSCPVPMNGSVPIVFKPAAPDQPGTITPTAPTVCINGTLGFSVSAVPGVLSYTWSAPGGTVLSGQGTSSVQMQFSSSGNPIQVSVTASNECGTSTASTIPVTVVTNPSAPTDITYNETNLCIGSNRTFLVSPIISGFTYSWVVQGSGWAFADDNITSASVNITIGSGPGTIKVKAVNSSGCSSPEYSETANGIAASPIFNVSGNSSICPGTSTSIHLDGSNPDYTYTLLADGVGIESKVGTNTSLSFSVTPPVDYPPTYAIEAQDPAGSCPVPMNGSVTVEFMPAPPDQPGFISGAFYSVCDGSSVILSIEEVARATSYTWSGGMVIAGQNQLQAEIQLSPSSNSAKVLVIANNECGSSPATSRLIPVTKVKAPVFQPPYPNQCAGGEYTYSVEPSSGYTYDWEAPDTWEIVGGQGESSARLRVGRYDGAVKVAAKFNGCLSETRSLNMDISEPPGIFALYGSDIICAGESSTISLSGSIIDNDYTLKRGEATIMSLVGTGQPLTFGTFSTSGTYKVYSNKGGQCFYPMDGEAVILVEDFSSAATSITASAYETCANSQVILSVFGGILGSGASWKWYAGTCTGDPIGTGSSISVSPTVNTTYYVRAEGNCNTTTCANVTITTVSNCPDRSALSYVRTRTPQKPGYEALPVYAPVAEINDEYQYVDALGRSSQRLFVQATPTKKDLLSIDKYDRFGREVVTYLPASIASNNGMITTSPESIITNFYSSAHTDHPENVAESEAPYAKTIYELSPLGRVLKQGAPGVPWQPAGDNYSLNDHTVKYRFRSNIAREVLMWTYDNATGLLQANAESEFKYYAPNTLTVNETFDEHNNLVLEYIDKQGKVVLKRVQANANQTTISDLNFASTYYVYDSFGNLVVVLPPEAVKQITE